MSSESLAYDLCNKTYNECFVCGDRIDLTAQVCSRFCMRQLEQMTEMDLEAQVESPRHMSRSDFETSSPHQSAHKVLPEQRQDPILLETEDALQPPHKSY